MNKIIKYPRTPHIEGSRIQKGDKRETIPISFLKNKYVVIEEKVDGANCAISFEDLDLLLQSRGHYLTGGQREKHFDLFKTFANEYIVGLYDLLRQKYIMYGEWLFAKHTIFYTDLPSYFLEFDIYDKEFGYFLSTNERQRLLKDYPFIKSVPIIKKDKFNLSLTELKSLITKSNFIKDNHIEELEKVTKILKLNFEQVKKETDNSDLMEGLYLKWEEKGEVKGRYKLVRESYLQSVEESNSHWLNRPIIPNQFKNGLN